MRAIGGWNGVSSGIGPAFIVRLWLQLIALQHTSMPVRDQGTSRDDSATNAYAVNEGQEFSHSRGRDEMWRGGCRPNISVVAPFVWRWEVERALMPPLDVLFLRRNSSRTGSEQHFIHLQASANLHLS